MDLSNMTLGKWKHSKELSDPQSLVCLKLTSNPEFYVIISYWATKVLFFVLGSTFKALSSVIYNLRR